MIVSLNDIKDELEVFREQNISRGLDTGFKCLDELYSIKYGTFTIFHGAPGHGKSEIMMQLCINQALKYNMRTALYTPETGNAKAIYFELMHKYSGKNFMKSSKSGATESEFVDAMNFVGDYFEVFSDEAGSYSLKGIMDATREYESKLHNGRKKMINIVMAEPWNELNHSDAMREAGGRQDLAIELELTEVRRFAENTGKHVFLSLHPGRQEQLKDKATGSYYYGMPMAREAYGGQAALRKAFNWINIWRPREGLLDENGMPYAKNIVLLQVEKTKPKGVGQRGATQLYYDWQRNSYYEVINGNNSYAFEHLNDTPIYRPGNISNTISQFDNAPF